MAEVADLAGAEAEVLDSAAAEAVDSMAGVEAVRFAAAVAAVHFVGAVEAVRFAGAVEAVRFAEAVAASEAAELFAEAADSAEDMVAMVAGTVTDAATGEATDSSLASATPPGIGPVMPTIPTIMDIRPPMVIRVTTDTIRTLTVEMARTDHMPLIRPRLL
jgi:hypothetical protein